jgi:hypothetical protein
MQKSIVLLMIFGFSLSASMAQNTYENEWKEVESFVRKGLPQSALRVVDSIYQDSKAKNNAPQFLKAALYQVRLKSDYQEDFMEGSIAQIGQELLTAKSPVSNILYTIRAELYWRYYQGNRYKFMERTHISNPDPEDIKTWDIKTLVDAVKADYLASLEGTEILRKIDLSDFDPILEPEKDSKIYRPTLYDFLAHRALEYFMNDEAGVTRPAIEFMLDKADYFAGAASFSTMEIIPGNNDDNTYRAILLFRDLIRFHLADKDPAALIDVDLARLKYVRDKSTVEGRDEIFLKALSDLQNRYPDHPHSADVAYEIAKEYYSRGEGYNPLRSDTNRWDLKKAREICDETISKYPGTNGARNCSFILNDILDATLNFTVNYANVPDQPFPGLLTFKNIKDVYFRIIKFSPEDDRALNQKDRGENIITQYLKAEPFREWSVKLPDEGDYQVHSTQIAIPALPAGYYIILASDNPGFSVQEKIVAYSSCWVTGISYVSMVNSDEGRMEVFVLDRDKGTALQGVKAQAWVREYNYQQRAYENKALDSYISGEGGYFSIPPRTGSSKSFYLEFTYGEDRFYTENYFYVNPPYKDEKSRITTHFFTDRSIYRPGQTVYFKGIVLETTGNKSEIKPDYSSVVTFYDVNGQIISELAMTTNEFGSINGTFTAPSGGLTGEMSIRSATGSTSFSVEEYKRPRFKVEVEPMEGSYRLNEEVKVTGNAMNYNGSAVDQAVVSYRVVRRMSFPIWRSWWRWLPYRPDVEITSGRTVTDADGKFNLSFTAVPDRGTDRKYKPVFNYTVYADVTDISGEVRSAEANISVGYEALLLDLDIPEKLDITKDKSFRLTATNLNRQPVSADVKISVFPLEAPSRLIRERPWGRPDVFVMSKDEFIKIFPNALYDDENVPENWKIKDMILTRTLSTANDSVFVIENPEKWTPGEYMLKMESTDAFGEKVEIKKYFTVYSADNKQTPAHQPFWYDVVRNQGEPGDTARLIVGSAEKDVNLLYEIENDGKIVSREWLQLDQEKVTLDIPIREEYRGNFFINLVFIRANNSYKLSEKITVPFTDKELKITTETFRDKLTPGQLEEWKLRISGPKGEIVAAEMLASMYDASLDAFREHSWMFSLYPSRHSAMGWNVSNAFTLANSRLVIEEPQRDEYPVFQAYDRLNWFGFNYYGSRYPGLRGGLMEMSMMKNAVPEMDGRAADEMAAMDAELPATGEPADPGANVDEPKPKPEMPLRKNFNETAFFFPALMTDEKGDVILKFTIPESLTSWKLMALAYTKDLKTGQLEKEVVTRKELMVMTNPPRFFRSGDRIMFSTKLVSLSENKLQGEINAEFFDAYTMQPLDELLGNKVKIKDFTVEKGQSQAFQWEITIPEGIEAIVCRVKASSGEFADGEEIVVPVLPNRMLVTESLPLPVNGKGTKNFRFAKLINSEKSTTIKSYKLTLEFTSNPAWYAVQALPYLTENTHESADALFSRYYANTLASYIANSNPKIKQVFENWKNLTPDALLSNLEKNQELKAVLLNETPWVMEAKNETERKKRIALLFDLNRMAGEQRAALQKLQMMQTPNGGWSWFDGMPDSRHTTQLIVTGIGKLHHLGVIDLNKEPELKNMVQRAGYYLDLRLKEDYDDILKYHKNGQDENHLSSMQIQYLYVRSYLKDIIAVSSESKTAFDYFKGQALKYWTEQNKYMQGMIAIALSRFEDPATAAAIISSLKENALISDELGMYWRDLPGYYWFEAPVERQAMLIEAFTEVGNDTEAVEQMKIWLLKQKQTQDWKTSRATADAVYALLLRGVDLLASDQLVEVSLGDEKIDPLTMDGVEVQAGTGYFQVSKAAGEITPEMGNVKVVKKDDGIAWGAVYWQYFENLDKITAAETPLSIEKELYVERNTPTGPVLDPVFDNSILQTGDKVKVRIIIRTDRDMEYVHMKDMRAAAFEPVAVISGYRYQDGLGYYESIRDASVNFYFDYLRKGTYVFEYPLNVSQAGEFSNGITSIQCLYAPEFAAHSEGVRVMVE